MKKAMLLPCLCMCLMLTSCKDVNNELETAYNDNSKKVKESSMFIEVESTYTWRIVYHKETKVMYAVSDGSYNYGTFTLLVDENGKPLLYKGDNNGN